MAMEFRSVIYNAARDGNLRRLKVFLDSRRDDEIQSLLSACTFGTPPLVIASRNGHVDVVKYLVEKKADIEQPGFVVFDGETIEGAPPLWCAAAAGHFDVVQFLIEKGANVNHTTATNSTPLRAACFDGHIDIVKYLVEHGADVEIANRHGHTSLMIACYRAHIAVVHYLLGAGADVNRKSLKGNTALHDSAESGSVEILKILLDKSARMVVDFYGLTPMLAAATLGHATVVEFLSTHAQCSWQERVDGLQLLGATYIDKKRDLVGALRYWRRALLLKTIAPEEADLKSISREPVKAYGGQREVENVEELDQLIGDPDKIRMQALLIRERVLGAAHPDTTYYIRYRGAVYADVGNFDRCVELWLYALKMQQTMMDALCNLTLGSFVSFAELFSFMLSDSGPPRGRRLRFDDIYSVLTMAIDEVVRSFHDNSNAVRDNGEEQRCAKSNGSAAPAAAATTETKEKDKDKSGAHRLCLIILHLICLLCRIENRLDTDQETQMKTLVYKLVRLDPRGVDESPLLHLACNAESTTLGRYPVCRFPALNVVETLLRVGADPNASDEYGNSPLHIILNNKVQRRSIVLCLLDNGCHLDRRNKQGRSPLDMIKQTSVSAPCLHYVNLKCLAARVIRQQNINYRGKVPTTLIPFIEMH